MLSEKNTASLVAQCLQNQEISYHAIAAGVCDFVPASDIQAVIAELGASSKTWHYNRAAEIFASKSEGSPRAQLWHVVDYSQVVVLEGVPEEELFCALMLFADLHTVRKFMIAVKWNWTKIDTLEDYLPDVLDMVKTCRHLVHTVLAKQCNRAATGGFEVSKTVDCDGTERLHLMFKMSSAEFCLNLAEQTQ